MSGDENWRDFLLRAPRKASQSRRLLGLPSVLQLAVIAVLLQSAPGHDPGGGSRRNGFIYHTTCSHHLVVRAKERAAVSTSPETAYLRERRTQRDF